MSRFNTFSKFCLQGITLLLAVFMFELSIGIIDHYSLFVDADFSELADIEEQEKENKEENKKEKENEKDEFCNELSCNVLLTRIENSNLKNEHQLLVQVLAREIPTPPPELFIS